MVIKILLILFLFLSPTIARSETPYCLWPTILFVKGQDLCQFEEGYGASSREGMEALFNLDALIDKNRGQAKSGSRMDITLEASLKAYLDHMYLGFNPNDIKLQFVDPSPLSELIVRLRDQERRDSVDLQQLAKLSGIVSNVSDDGR